MVGAYETYKQQWTSSGRKKLVKDASKALKEYHSRYNYMEPNPEHYDETSPDFHTDVYGRPTTGQPQPDDLSLLYLGPQGPEVPLLSTMMQGFESMMKRAVRNTHHMMKNVDMQKAGEHMVQSVGYTAEEILFSYFFFSINVQEMLPGPGRGGGGQLLLTYI